MKGCLSICKKEFHYYFNSPIAYVFIGVFLIVATGLFMTPFFLAGLCDMRAFFANLPLLLVIFVPAITMRLWSEETRRGTLGLLFSLPFNSTTLVLGKYFSSFLFCALAILSTTTIPIMLHFLGNPDIGPIVGGYLGSLLLLSFLISLGMSISAFFKDQIVAFILSLVAGFFCFLAGTEFFSTFVDSWVGGLGTFLRHAIGLQGHFASFAKGVIDISDIIFFISYTVAFLAINILTLEGLLKFRIQKGFVPSVLLMVGIAVFLNAIASDHRWYRLDLTENKIYTISPGTVKVLARLKVPITVTYYCSSKDKLPTAMKEMPRDVGDILDEFSKLSPMFTYKIVAPESLSQREKEEIAKKGIVPFNAQTIERDSLNIKRVYSALQLSYLDKKDEIIPQVLPDSLGSLEYEIVSKIFRLSMDKEPKIVMVAPKEQIPPQMALMYQRLGQPIPPAVDHYKMLEELLRSQGYMVSRQEISKDHPIPDDASAMLILGPWKLNRRQLYEIKKFLSTGKPVILAFQHYRYGYTNGPKGISASVEKMDNNLNSLIKDFGLKVDEDMLFDKSSAVLSIESSKQMGLFTALVRTPVRFPMQIKILPDSMNKNISITSNLNGLLYLWGSPLQIDEKKISAKGLRVTDLFKTSKYSWTRKFHPGILTHEDLTPKAGEFSQRPLAILVRGSFENQTSEAEVPPWPDDEKEKKSKDEKQKETKKETEPTKASKLILIGSSTMFTDNAISALSNGPLILNCMDVLCLGDELINVRTKQQSQRLIREIEPGQRLMWKLFTTLLMPAFWTIMGIIHSIRRKKARKRCEFDW